MSTGFKLTFAIGRRLPPRPRVRAVVLVRRTLVDLQFTTVVALTVGDWEVRSTLMLPCQPAFGEMNAGLKLTSSIMMGGRSLRFSVCPYREGSEG